MTYLFFGDSITYGTGDSHGGWVGRFRKEQDEKALASDFEKADLAYNLGVPGDTSTDLVARIENEIRNRIDAGDDVAIIFAIGTNDSQFIIDNDKNKVDSIVFRSNLKYLINIARKFTSNISFVGLMPVDESRVNPTPWAPDRAYRNNDIKQYNQIIKDVCGQEKVKFSEFYDSFAGLNYCDLLIDGIHPNEEGYNRMFKIIKTQ